MGALAKKKLEQYWQVSFAVLAFLFVISTFIEPYPASWLIKVLPMIVLIFVAREKLDWIQNKWLIIGLVFSALGDFVLDYFDASGFIFGLSAFFIAHIFYLFYFSKWAFSFKSSVIALLVLIYGLWAMSLIIDHLGELFIPVIAYMGILTVMAFASVFSVKSNPWFVLGGISFVISDSILGINKFNSDVAYSHVIIMVSYYFAQYSLLKGSLQFNSQGTK